MDDAQMGAMTDITHDVQMGCMDDAWTFTMTDISHEVRMGFTDDAWTGAPKGIMYDVQFSVEFSTELQGIFDGFAADSDELTDGLSE